MYRVLSKRVDQPTASAAGNDNECHGPGENRGRKKNIGGA